MQKTHVVMLLDESSSMTLYREAVVDTFNQYTKELKGTKRCWLSLFKFSGRLLHRPLTLHRDPSQVFHQNRENLRKVFENRRLKDCYPLTTPQYHPNGWTPLFDSIGELIQRTKKRLPKDAKVLFVVHTDGQENTSTRYNQERLKNLIHRMENKRGWTFVYLGEGAEAWNAGYDFGIDNVANFSSSLRGASMGKLATATNVYAASCDVGGAAGTTKTFYQNASLTPDDINPTEDPHITSTAKPHADMVKPMSTSDDAT